MKKTGIFGYGAYCREKISELQKIFEVSVIFDKKAGMAGMFHGNIPVVPVSEIGDYRNQPIMIMVSDFLPVVAELLEMGVEEERILFAANYVPYHEADREIFRTDSKVYVRDGKVYYQSIYLQELLIRSTEDLYRIPGIEQRIRVPVPAMLGKMATSPVSRQFGYDRGTPIDRMYIERFLDENRQYIRGDVMEIAEDTYTHRYGGGNVENAYILHIAGGEGCIKGDLATGEGIDREFLDCFICTQTFNFIYDIFSACKNLTAALKPGGTALVTVSGILQISRYDMDRWGQYWGFTDKSMEQLFRKSMDGAVQEIEIKTYGNVKSAVCYLEGLCAEELTEEELWKQDRDYQVIITCRVTKGKRL